MVKPILILTIMFMPILVLAQGAFKINSQSLSYNSRNLLSLSKTNLKLESQYSQNPEIYSASQASYTRLSLESGVIGLGFIPLRMQGYYSTEKQDMYHENYFRVSFDLNLLLEYQKAKAQQKIEEQNRKLIYLKRDFDKQKDLLKSKNKFTDSLIGQLQLKLKSTLRDSASKLQNKYKNKLQDSLNDLKNSLDKLRQTKPNLKDSLNNINQCYRSKAEGYKEKYKDSLKRETDIYRRLKGDSILKQIEKLKSEKKSYEKQLSGMQDSIKKIENSIKTLLEIVKNPKAKVQEMIGKKVHLPKTFQIGRINPYFSESVLNGTPAKGVLIEFQSEKKSTTISFGRLSGFPEPNINRLNFKSEYFAYKQGFKVKDFSYELGIFNS